MNYILRSYQKTSTEKGIEYFNSKSVKNSMLVLPTGSGKSLIIANIAKELDEDVLIFQPSKELLEQNFNKYISYGCEAEIYSASFNRKEIAHVTFATIGSVYKKPELFNSFKYCIIDECHLVSPDGTAMYQKFLTELNMKVLGLTATPVRMKRYAFPEPYAQINMLDRMRPRFFTDYLHVVQIKEMVENGWFAPIEYRSIDFDSSMLKINSTGGDFTERSISESFKNNSILKAISNISHKLLISGEAKHILIFVDSIDNAEELSDLIGRNKCMSVTSGTKPKERANILKRFKSGELPYVVNVGVLTTGFDFPELDCIISARPTMSLSMYYQIIGRAVRPHPTKKKSIIYDLVGNYERFGRVEDLIIEKKQNKWVIHNGVNQLTNVPIHEISQNSIKLKMNFGKYKGEDIEKVPKHYLEWVKENVEPKAFNKEIFDYIKEKGI